MDTSFMDNLTVKQTEYGLYVETYGKIDTDEQMGSCHYAQAYTKGESVQEAKQRFIDFYKPMWLADNA